MNTIRRERRPLWQRLSLPVLGALMIVVGTVGLIVPIIPGLLLFALGFPLLFCFHETSEDWAKGVVRRCFAQFKRLVMPRQKTARRGELPLCQRNRDIE
jgi:uncharacterized membrane protein YbaN (DUF454 family)